jgi:hypothetical protein
LAPTVSNFVRGSDYIPLEYAETENFRESHPVTSHNVAFMHKEAAAVPSANRRKPDFSMTNFGLHIQLPMNRVPAAQRFYSIVKSTKKPLLYRGIRFAFLACQRRKSESKTRLVAIPLHKINDLSYTRTTFNGHTLHLIDNEHHPDQCLPITSFDPVWICKARYDIDEYAKSRWPSSIKRVEFEISCSKPTPLASVTNPFSMNDDDEPHYTWRDAEDQMPHRLGIQGVMSTAEFGHEVLAIQNISPASKCYTLICFGVADRHLWMCTINLTSYDRVRSIDRYVRYPTGLFWKKLNRAFSVYMNKTGSFTTDSTDDCSRYKVQYALSTVSDEEVSLRMKLYVV